MAEATTASPDAVGSIARVDGIQYRIQAVKRGGMGTVYLLSRLDDSETVIYRSRLAAKTFGNEQSHGEVRRELTNWLSLKHPHIVELLAIGDLDFQLAALMPVADASVADIIAKTDMMRTHVAVEFLQPVVNGLHYAWSKAKLLHLDIKPGNILVFRSNSGRKEIDVQVSDWGMSRLVDASGSSGGTLPYMSPERFVPDVSLSTGADIFSLGMTLFQLLTKSFPFPESSDIVRQLITGEYISSAMALLERAGVHRTARRAVCYLIHPDPRQRIGDYADARQALADIGRNPRWQFFTRSGPR